MSSDIIHLTVTDPADDEQQMRSEADLATVVDVTMWHQMPHLPAHRLIQLNCERWPVWSPGHQARIVEARRLDDSRDWYFPIITKKWISKPEEIVPPELCWAWSGVWHESADHAHTERALALPPMTYLRQDWRYANFMLYQIAASQGGLLLIWTQKEMIPKRRSPRVSKSGAETDVPFTSASVDWSTVNRSDYREIINLPWTRLLVCNPLTKEFRELPALNCDDIDWGELWRRAYYHSVQVHMVVDEEANSYQVILLLNSILAVYKSMTNSWNWLQFQRHHPWCEKFSSWMFSRATERVGSTFYLADVRMPNRRRRRARANARSAASRMEPVSDPTPAAALRLFEVDAEAGTWRLLYEYTLRKFHLPVLHQYPELFPFDMRVVNNVELVGCMGDLYAVVPTRLHDVVTVGHKQTPLWKNELQNFDTTRGRLKRQNRQSFELRESKEIGMREVGVKYMPLVFYVMQLRSGDGVLGEGVDHAVLRIELPNIRSIEVCRDYMARKQRMYNVTDAHRSRAPHWFKCEARGSVIWVSYEDYLLSYDVVSRKCTTQMIRVEGGGSSNDTANHVARLAYRPSFHMKP